MQPEKGGEREGGVESGRFAIKGGMIDSFSLLGSVPTLSKARVADEGIITGLEPHVGHRTRYAEFELPRGSRTK